MIPAGMILVSKSDNLSDSYMWYVVRCFMNDFAPVREQLVQAGFQVEVFSVKELTSLFFLQASVEDVRQIERAFPFLHFYKERKGSRVVLQSLPDDTMRMLRRVVEARHSEVCFKEEGVLDHLSGKQVRVVSGDFEGVMGKLCRFQGQRHVCFNVPGACTVCTPYIPASQLEEL